MLVTSLEIDDTVKCDCRGSGSVDGNTVVVGITILKVLVSRRVVGDIVIAFEMICSVVIVVSFQET